MDAIESLDWLSAISHNPLMITLIASSIQKGKKVMTMPMQLSTFIPTVHLANSRLKIKNIPTRQYFANFP